MNEQVAKDASPRLSMTRKGCVIVMKYMKSFSLAHQASDLRPQAERARRIAQVCSLKPVAFLSLIFAVAVMMLPVRPAMAVKPRPPLRVSLRLLNDPKPGDVARIEITVKSTIDLDKVAITCSLPKGVIFDEETEWQADIKKNVRHRITLELILPEEKTYKLIARANAQIKKRRIANVAKLIIDLDPAKKQKTKPNVIETKDGEKLRIHMKKRK